jgi:hypothetical protein
MRGSFKGIFNLVPNVTNIMVDENMSSVSNGLLATKEIKAIDSNLCSKE